MKKLLFKLRALMLLLLMMVGVSSVWAEDATMAAGTNGSTATVNSKSAIKVGTSSKGGDMTITVPAGATSLEFYAAAWNGVTGLSLNITPAVNVSPTSVSLTADTGISGNSPFSLSGVESSYKFTIALSNITAETTLKLTSSATKRFVVWGATYTTGGGDTPESAPTITTQPRGAFYDQGDAATALSVVATGNPTPSYQWYSNTTTNSNQDGEKISGATSASYTPSTANEGTTYYYCVATNDLGSVASDAVSVTVNAVTLYTVTFDAGTGTCSTGSLTQQSKGASITLPEATTVTPATTEDGCAFLGWATSKVTEATTTKPVVLPGTTYTPTDDITLYAVYQYILGGNGGYYLSEVSNDITHYMTATAGSTTSVDEATEFFWEDGYLYSKSNNTKTYISHASSGNTSLVINTREPSYKWTITDNSSTVEFRSTAQTTRYLGYGSNAFKAYATPHTLTKTACGTKYYSSVVSAPTYSDVTLNINGGTVNADNVTTYREGREATLPTDVTKTGYIFSGWYDNEELRGEAVTVIPSDATGEKTFWAKWNAHTYSVAFNANGGSGEMSNQNFTYDEPAKALAANAFTKTGYSFAGWATTSEGDKAYDNEQSVQNLTSEKGATVILYALWSVNNYDVVFDKNNANATGEMSNQSITFGKSANLTTNAFTSNGQLFTGWATSADGEVAYSDGANYTMTTEGATLYAKWIDDIRVSSVTLSETSKTVTYGAEDFALIATIAPDNAVDKTVTWISSDESVATVSNGTVHIVGAGSATITVKSNADETKTASCSLTVSKADAVITPTEPDNTWYVTLKIGATLTPTFSTTPADAQVSLEITSGSDKVSLENGRISGVAAGSATVTATFAGNDNYNKLVKTFNITIPEKLTLTYSVNGNTEVKAAGHYYEGDEVDLSAPASNIPEGYVFKGWVSESLAEVQQTAPTYVDATMPAESTTYYAVFAVEDDGPKTPTLVNSIDVLCAGSTYFISSSSTYSAEAVVMAKRVSGNNFPETTFGNNPVALVLGGNATDGWTFSYADVVDDAPVTLYLDPTNTTSSNHLKTNKSVTEYGKFTISFSNDAAVITSKGKSSRNIVRYNSASKCFSCYSSGQDPVYLYAGFTPTYFDYCTSVVIKTLIGIEFGGSLEKTVYTEEEIFDPTGITVLASYEGEDEKEDITSKVNLSYSTEPLAVGTTSVNVSASYKGFDINRDYAIKVNAIPTYSVTIVSPENGTLTVKNGEEIVNSGDAFRAGTVLTIEATPAEHFSFRNLQVVDATTHTFTASNTKEWTMGENSITIKANFDAVPQYQVAWMSNGVQVKQETVYANEGSTIPDVTVPTGYVLSGWVTEQIVTETAEEPDFVTLTDNKYMPTAATTLHAVFKRSEGVETVYTFNKNVTGFPTTYNNPGVLLTVNEFKFTLTDVAYFSGTGDYMQFKRTSGSITNSTQLPSAVKTVVVTYNSGTSNNDIAVWLGENENSYERSIKPSNDGTVYTFDCISYNYRFIQIIAGSSAAAVDEIVLTCGGDETYYTTLVKKTPTLSFSPAEYWVSEGATIVTPQPVVETDGEVSYVVTDGTAASLVDNMIQLAGNGQTGDVTITANAAASATYESASASYTLHVVAPRSLSVSAAGWATFAPSMNVELPAGVSNETVRVYHVATNDVNNNTIAFTETSETITAGKTIVAGTGIMVKAEAGTYYFPVNTTVEPTKLTGNQLVGVLSSTAKPGDNAFIFKNGSQGIGFYPWSAGNLAAFKCYLQLTPAQAAGEVRFIGLPEDDELSTSIELVFDENGTEDSYNLFGQKVDTRNYKGIIVKGGVKSVVK